MKGDDQKDRHRTVKLGDGQLVRVVLPTLPRLNSSNERSSRVAHRSTVISSVRETAKSRQTAAGNLTILGERLQQAAWMRSFAGQDEGLRACWPCRRGRITPPASVRSDPAATPKAASTLPTPVESAAQPSEVDCANPSVDAGGFFHHAACSAAKNRARAADAAMPSPRRRRRVRGARQPRRRS